MSQTIHQGAESTATKFAAQLARQEKQRRGELLSLFGKSILDKACAASFTHPGALLSSVVFPSQLSFGMIRWPLAGFQFGPILSNPLQADGGNVTVQACGDK